jgi:quercetin dioxygenase-like cupin family protein
MVTRATGKAAAVLAACAAVVLGSACSSEPAEQPVVRDPVAGFPAHYSALFENEDVRILKITYAPGDKTAMHHHPDGIVIALEGGTTRFTAPDGTTQDAELPTDTGRYMPAGDHAPENVGASRLEAILVEFKRAQPGTATVPAAREGMAMTMLAEGPYASAYRITAEPTFEEPEGTTHEYDQVVIALAPAEVSLSLNGQPAKTTWARGDVQFIGRGTPHASKNLSGTPVDYAIVTIK